MHLTMEKTNIRIKGLNHCLLRRLATFTLGVADIKSGPVGPGYLDISALLWAVAALIPHIFFEGDSTTQGVVTLMLKDCVGGLFN